MTILLQTYNLKYPDKAFLVRKFCLFVCFVFFVLHNFFCILAKFRAPIPNTTIEYHNRSFQFLVKNTQNNIFGLKFKDFFLQEHF